MECPFCKISSMRRVMAGDREDDRCRACGAPGIPVVHCRDCNGYLAPRKSAAAISERFRFLREHGEKYARMGESLAGAVRRRMELEQGPAIRASGIPLPLPG